MIYLGDYNTNEIYGTTNNRKIKVTTEDNANFLYCELKVTYNGFEWSHPFEVPFFNNSAELYFENYIHSILTQQFEITEFSQTEYTLSSFAFAAIEIVLQEKKQTEVLEEQTLHFFMSLGAIDTLQLDDITNGLKQIILTSNSKYITTQHLLSFSFISKTLPNKLIVNNGINTSEVDLPTPTTSFYLHTLTIPVGILVDLSIKSLTVSVSFPDGTTLLIGNFIMLPGSADHNLVAYQNYYGTYSTIEFTGILTIKESFKIKNNVYQANNKSYLQSNKLEQSVSNTINTGFLLDTEKQEMVKELINSFNIFLLRETFQRIVLTGKQNTQPYRTNEFLKDETLKFKLSENDHIYNTVF